MRLKTELPLKLLRFKWSILLLKPLKFKWIGLLVPINQNLPGPGKGKLLLLLVGLPPEPGLHLLGRGGSCRPLAILDGTF